MTHESKCPTCGKRVPYWVYAWETVGWPHRCPHCTAAFRFHPRFIWPLHGINLLLFAASGAIGIWLDQLWLVLAVMVCVAVADVFVLWLFARFEKVGKEELWWE